jgi:ATP-dependent helicase STH1/SNF2
MLYINITQKYKQMKEQGVSEQDAEYQKVHQMLSMIQQQRMYNKQKQAYAAQMQQQQQSASTAVTNGNNAQRIPQQNSNSVPPQPSSTPNQPSIPSKPTAVAAVQAAQRSSTAGSGYFTPDQLGILKHQIFAFKCLSKNLGIPATTKDQLFNQQKKRAPSTDLKIAVVANALESAKSSVNGGPRDASVVPESTTDDKEEAPFVDPNSLVQSVISYARHSTRMGRKLIPSIMPAGIDVDKLREDRERVIYNRMSARYQELKSLPANMAHWDTRKSDELAPEDTLKRKALIEMKMLEQYARQRKMRESIGRQMIQYDNLAMTANRSMYRRMKKQSLREARITEKLEKQQRDARETREKKKHTDYLQTVLQHHKEIEAAQILQKQKMQKLGRMMLAQHQNIEKEEQKRIERTAKQRLAALRNNDEEAYFKLLDQAKDTRITHLLKQTDGFLNQLAASVKAQQRKAAERYGDTNGEFMEDESEEDEDEQMDSDTRKIDYYAVAHRIKEEVHKQPSMLVGGTLKEYQLKGLQWMISLYNNNLNGILADEMGLGKTIQTISLLAYLIEVKKQTGPFLVIVPLSTLTNWNMEFEKWAPSIARIVYKGPPNVRKQQQNQIRYGNFQVLLTTYEYIIKDRPVLSKIKWIHMIIDEGHRMKNANSKLSGTLSQYYSTRYRLILTGTPLQNNLPELWALLNFVLPTIFKSVKSFDEWFNTPFANTGGQDKMELTEEEQILVIRRLHKVLRPFLLRRLKKDVEKDLPDKTEKVIKCKFSALQARLYKQMVLHNKLVVSDGKGGKTGARGLSNMIMQLRKLCNHPFVFDEVENQMNPTSTSNDLLWRTSGKFELLDRVLPKYQKTGHRVLMFFQMTAIMDIMEDFLRLRGIMYLRLDGTTKSDDRSELLREFNAPDSPYFMFLLSTRAGGLGLNLQTADTVIIYDSDWNPHQDLQAQDRAHRIGQKNEVRILRLISSNSVEEKILERAKFKLDMDGKVIQAGRFDNKSSETDRDAMLRVMLETAESAETLEQEEMDDDDLNMILARSDAELEVFRQMDELRSRDLTYGTAPGSKRIPRLMVESELPDIYMTDENPIQEEPEELKGRGARERKTLKYDDGLTEEQWLNAVDDDFDTPEAAAARKTARKERRLQKRLKKEAGIIDNNPDSDGSQDSDDEPEPEPEPEPPKKGRGRKSAGKADKRKAEDFDDEPPLKRKRGGPGRPKAGASSGDTLSAQHRAVLQAGLRRIYDSLMKLESNSDAEEGEEDEEKRQIIGPFVALPHKKFYADYYNIIKRPICMKMIDTNIKKEEYSSLNDMKRDIELLANNARTYNEDGSILYLDANTIEVSKNHNEFTTKNTDFIRMHLIQKCKRKLASILSLQTISHHEMADLLLLQLKLERLLRDNRSSNLPSIAHSMQMGEAVVYRAIRTIE